MSIVWSNVRANDLAVKWAHFHSLLVLPRFLHAHFTYKNRYNLKPIKDNLIFRWLAIFPSSSRALSVCVRARCVTYITKKITIIKIHGLNFYLLAVAASNWKLSMRAKRIILQPISLIKFSTRRNNVNSDINVKLWRKIVAVITNINVNMKNSHHFLILHCESGMRTMCRVVSLEHSLMRIYWPC